MQYLFPEKIKNLEYYVVTVISTEFAQIPKTLPAFLPHGRTVAMNYILGKEDSWPWR